MSRADAGYPESGPETGNASTELSYYPAMRPVRAGRRLTDTHLASVVTVLVLLAYMPFIGRVDATSTALSGSRVAELLFLALAAAACIALRPRGRRMAASTASLFLLALTIMFSLWAMLTSLKGPFLLTGLIKAIELFTICLISFEITRCTRPLNLAGPIQTADIILLGIVVVVVVLIMSNIVVTGRPLPFEGSDDWLSSDSRPRLVLGANHPLTSALLLAFGLNCCINARATWRLRLPVFLSLAWLLYLCDARGISAGCVIGIVLCLFRKLPRSPYKLLIATFAVCVLIFVALAVVLTGQTNELILQFAGSDAFTLNSRIGLWSYVLARVPNNPLMGVGYYSTRYYILNAFPFAGHAHNSALEVLFSTGMIGETFFILFLGVWSYAVIVTADPLLIAVSPVVLLEGALDPILFTPGIGMFLMQLVLLNALFVTKGRSYRSKSPIGNSISSNRPAATLSSVDAETKVAQHSSPDARLY